MRLSRRIKSLERGARDTLGCAACGAGGSSRSATGGPVLVAIPPPVVRYLSEIPAACGRSEEADDRCRVCGRVLVIRIGPPTPAREAEQRAEGRAAA
ncbi:MAG: hypothetical protein KF869_15520 [Phycisphaeraceae bacterium]|nr:hypothetical protein [Phycisphaeraceae bacterium]